MSEFLQGLLACIIAAGFLSTAFLCASCALSGRITREEEARSHVRPPSGT